MTREELKTLLITKNFNSVKELVEYMELCGFDVEAVAFDYTVMTHEFYNLNDNVHFVSHFYPYDNTWNIVIFNGEEEAETITLRK